MKKNAVIKNQTTNILYSHMSAFQKEKDKLIKTNKTPF